MPRVVFVLGLCGAGKSTRAGELSAAGFENFDEKATGRSLHPEWTPSAYPDLLEAVACGRDCVVTEILFYLPDAQRRVTRDLVSVRPDVVFEWECFDHADFEVATYNCEQDPDRTAEGIRGNLQQNAHTIERLRTGPGTRLLKTVRRARVR